MRSHHSKRYTPQGNVLGSILYALFTVGLSAAPGTKIYTFADDTAILSTQKSIRKAIKTLQNHLNEIGKWTENNKIRIKTIKCVHVTFTFNKGPIPKIKFNNQELPQALFVKSELLRQTWLTPRQQIELEKAYPRKDLANKNN